MKSELSASQLHVHLDTTSKPFTDPIYGHTIAKKKNKKLKMKKVNE